MNTDSHNISDDIERHLLETLVPVNALTADHLKTLLRDKSVEAVCRGETLFAEGDSDNQTVYLLSGEISLVEGSGMSRVVRAEDPDNRFPLSNHQPRRHHATASSDCTVVRFDTDQLDAMLAWDQASRYIMLDITAQRYFDEDSEWILTLLRSNLFYKVPPMNIRKILDKFSAHYASAGDIILRQGELGDCCYYIKEGVAGVYQAENEKSSPSLVAELGVGRCFGEDALVNDAPRNATITMHTNGVLMRLDKRDFFLLLKSAAVASVNLAQARQMVSQGAGWVDVRTQDEYDNGHCDGAINMSLDLLKLKSRMLRNIPYIIYCNSGRRSEAAASLLTQDGFDVSVLAGGIATYSSADQAYFER